MRTGVTVIFPRGHADPRPVYGGFFNLNGNGEMTGRAYLEDFGIVQGPIGLSDTNAIGQVYAGIQQWSFKAATAPRPGPSSPKPGAVISSDIEGFHVTCRDRDRRAGRGEGRDRSRKGMSAAGPAWSASASRAGSARRRASFRSAGETYTIGVLVQCNTGDRKVLRIAGAPVGQAFAKAWLPCFDPKLAAKAPNSTALQLPTAPRAHAPPDQGSIIIVVGTDAPLMPKQLNRVAKRAATGSRAARILFRQCSGDLIVSFLDRCRRGQQDRTRTSRAPIAPIRRCQDQPGVRGGGPGDRGSDRQCAGRGPHDDWR